LQQPNLQTTNYGCVRCVAFMLRCMLWLLQGHAEEYVRGLSLDQLQDLDGIVAVGGDGLFAELLTAVLQHKHLAAALQLRLGHIPAGSTDAVACT
jgi:ceramide kinase